MKIKRDKLNPRENLEKKANHQTHYLVERDGSINETNRLVVKDSSLRESIICNHFLINYVKCFLKELTGINIISRDDPWDFKLELSNNENFNIEITAIADDEVSFEKSKNEERLKSWIGIDKIALHELIRLNKAFSDSLISDKIKEFLHNGVKTKELVDNPYKESQMFIFLSENQSTDNFRNILIKAVLKKVQKKHKDKENTILTY